MKRILITGICGFIGHHLVEEILRNTDWEIVGLDRLSYASNGMDRLRDIKAFDENRVLMLTADFTKPIKTGLLKEIGKVDYIVHMGANTHVDNSIKDPISFAVDNVIGTVNVLELARKIEGLEKFIYFSTDEIFGPAPDSICYREGERHNPSNPYSASKAGAEDFCVAYANTYKLPIIITNTMNVIGERQHPEKYVPLVVNKVLSGEKVTIHASPDKKKAGSRYYIHARNVAHAIVYILKDITEYLDIHEPSEGRFNIVGEIEMDNLELAQFIADVIGKELIYEMVDFHGSRPGHDLRYALDGTKMFTLGWDLPKNFKESLKKTIKWSLDNPKWLSLEEWGK